MRRDSLALRSLVLGALLASLQPIAQAGAPDEAPPSSGTAAAAVDRQLSAELGITEQDDAAPRCDDEVFLRRVFLDVIGRPPTVDDLLAFQLDARPDKRARVVEQLLGLPQYGENWGRYWRDVVMTRRTEPRALLSAPALTQFFTESLNTNRPWGEVATAMITASGDVRENGATGLIMAQGGMPEETVSEISRIFLGIQIQCAQCHDHPTDRWKREQFHELAAFFPRVSVRPSMTDDRTFLVVGNDSPMFRQGPMQNRFRGTPEHRMPDLKRPEAPGEVMTPVLFATGDQLALGTPDQDRRDALAAWLTSTRDPWFARAIVNRLWSELVGEGFYEPVDDLGPDREATAPQTLDLLAEQFVASGHDVKRLMATILATEAYQRESRPRRAPDAPPFRANVAQRLRSDQLYDSLLRALEIDEPPTPNVPGRPYGLAGPRMALEQVFGYDPSVPRDEVKGSIPQALLLMNSPMLANAMSARPGTMLARLLGATDDDTAAVRALYLQILSRQPREEEVSIFQRHRAAAASRAEAFEDLLWALINSSDFLHRG